MSMPPVFAERRARVLKRLGAGGALVLAAAPELRVGHDTELRYVVDADFWYLTGYREPEAVMVLRVSDSEPVFTMFVRPRDRKKETWSGPRGGVEAAVERFGADAAFPIHELTERLPKLLAGVDRLYARLESSPPGFDRLIRDALATARRNRPRTGHGPLMLIEPGAILDDMRLFKDAEEVESLRAAATLTVEAFRAAASCIRPGAGEWQVEAKIEYEFRVRGASGPAFPTIVASGPNATVLHYVENDRVMNAGDLLLLDAGARWRMYCADITRTFPVGGTFEGRRAALYEVVHAAHMAGIEAVRPGNTIDAVHEAVRRTLAEGLIELKLVEGDVDAVLADNAALACYYPHRTSHWLGIDVHDPGDYVTASGPRMLEPGMVLTVEPGLYLPADDDTLPAAWRGMGIRLEDDVLVTAEGRDVLTAALPVTPSDVATLAG